MFTLGCGTRSREENGAWCPVMGVSRAIRRVVVFTDADFTVFMACIGTTSGSRREKTSSLTLFDDTNRNGLFGLGGCGIV